MIEKKRMALGEEKEVWLNIEQTQSPQSAYKDNNFTLLNCVQCLHLSSILHAGDKPILTINSVESKAIVR